MTTRNSEAGMAPQWSSSPGRLYLAPMEGVMDATMRDITTRSGGFDLCVTEFLRIVDDLLPEKVFYRLCPELLQGSQTPSGVPVRLQLLGQNPQALAENAARAVALGSPGVDLNFGCPAKTVNKSRGGAILLTEPDTLYRIVSAVRAAVPRHQPVTAKMRLGFADRSLALDNARALEAGGAAEIVVHARTKVDGYKPPAHWEAVARIAEVVKVPVVANGDVLDRDSHQRCQQVSGVSDVMVGRGALAMPNLAAVLAFGDAPWPWSRVLDEVIALGERDIAAGRQRYMPSRIKQWLNYLRLAYPEADTLFMAIRRLRTSDDMRSGLLGYRADHVTPLLPVAQGEFGAAASPVQAIQRAHAQ